MVLQGEYCIVPLHESKLSKDECNNYREISLVSVPGKKCVRILTERLMEVTEGKVSKEQEGKRLCGSIKIIEKL